MQFANQKKPEESLSPSCLPDIRTINLDQGILLAIRDSPILTRARSSWSRIAVTAIASPSTAEMGRAAVPGPVPKALKRPGNSP